MGRPGYLSYRITAGRRIALDTIRAAFPSALTDREALDVALEWAAVSMPERLSQRQADRITHAVRDGLVASATANAHERSMVRNDDLIALVRKRHG